MLNSLMDVTSAGGALGIPGLYVTGDPGGIDEAAKKGSLSLSLGTGWAKSLAFTTGQCPVMKYNRAADEARSCTTRCTSRRTSTARPSRSRMRRAATRTSTRAPR